MAQKERIAELDYLRSFAFLAVVYQHVIGIYIRKPGVSEETSFLFGMLFHLMKFAVPAFVFVTGLVLFYNYYERLAYPRFIQKRFTEIIIPYLIWSLVYMVWHHDLTGWNLHTFMLVLKKWLTGTSSYHLWFVVMIFQFYLLYPVYRQLFRWAIQFFRGKVGRWGIIGAAALAYTALMWFSARYLPANAFRFEISWLDAYLIKFRDRNFLYYSFYFLMGGLAAFALPKFRVLLQRSWLSLFTAFGIMYGYIGYELVKYSGGLPVNLNVATTLKPSMFFYTVIQLLILYLLVLWVNTSKAHWKKALSLLGHYSYGAYLIHALVLTYVMKLLNKWEWTSNGLGGSLLAFVLCSLLSFLGSYLLAKLPFGSWLVGAAEKKTKSSPVRSPREKERQAI
ncbi:acyltransferase [Brevibacillus ruminantium]|uniref:Acyltransferase n=1 Tax=Brevibacillus ruminantium TaxID=2950604 RepID=A0ABY4WM43_9BACL|nr:acyltransferase [Brevibacillus ruminantium]USG68217.1 acyltransferase [Brevibacillus ruminantium]